MATPTQSDVTQGEVAHHRGTFTASDIMLRYDVTEKTVLGWIHSGELKAINVGREPHKKKPRWRITPQAVETFEALRQATPPVSKPLRRNRKQDSSVIKFY